MKKTTYLIFWLLLCTGEFIVPYFLGRKINNYNSLQTVMSAVGAKENGIISLLYRSWLVLFGIVTSVLFFYLKDMYEFRSYKTAMIIIIFYSVLGCVLCGIFPSEMTKEFTSMSAKIHAIAVVIAFFALMFVPLLLRKIFIYQNSTLGNVISILVFLTVLAIFILQVVSEREQFIGSIIGYTGLWQRLYLAILYAYIGIAMFYIIKVIPLD